MKTFLFATLLMCATNAFGLDAKGSAAVDELVAAATAAPATAEVQVDQLMKLGDAALIQALPRLIRLHPSAVKAGSEFYTLILLTRVSNLTTRIAKPLAEEVIALADPADEQHRACIQRIRINVSE